MSLDLKFTPVGRLSFKQLAAATALRNLFNTSKLKNAHLLFQGARGLWCNRANELVTLEDYTGQKVQTMVRCAPWGLPYISSEPVTWGCNSQFCPWCWCRRTLKVILPKFKALGREGELKEAKVFLSVHDWTYPWAKFPAAFEAVKGLAKLRERLRMEAQHMGSIGGVTLLATNPYAGGPKDGLSLSLRHLDIMPADFVPPDLEPLMLDPAVDDPDRRTRWRRTCDLKNRRTLASRLGNLAIYPVGLMYASVGEAHLAVNIFGDRPKQRLTTYGALRFPDRAPEILKKLLGDKQHDPRTRRIGGRRGRRTAGQKRVAGVSTHLECRQSVPVVPPDA